MYNVDFTGVDDNATFILNAGMSENDIGKVVSMQAEKTVRNAIVNEKFLGVLTTVDRDNYGGTVSQRGYHRVSYNGTAPVRGYNFLTANGAGGVRVGTSATGRDLLVVSVDTANLTAVIYLG